MISSKESASSSSTNLRRARARQPARLFIDTTGVRGAVVLTVGKQSYRSTFTLGASSTGALLRAVDSVLRRAVRRLRDVSRVDVVPGPGMFSRVRLGVVTANAFAWAMGVRLFVHGKRVRIAKPAYGAAPNITLEQKRSVVPPHERV